MDKVLLMKWLTYISTVGVFIYAFILFFQDTQAWGGSLAAALLSAGLVYISMIMLRWLVQVFLK